MKGKKNNVNWKDSKTDVLKTQQKILIAYNWLKFNRNLT
jgi:hypothetical protein